MEQQEKRFIDIHTHILPGVDDGARNMEEALQLLCMAWKNGTGAMVLTPHYRGKFKKNTPEQLYAIFQELSVQVKEQLPGMRLYLGNEAGNEHELSDKLLSGRVLTIAGTRYVLLEFAEQCYRSRVLSSVMDLVNSGYIPIIAHVERYDIFRKQGALAGEVTEMGALLQVNAESIMGSQGFALKQYCKKLLKRGMVHFVASDAHDPEERPPLLRDCYEWVCRHYGSEYARAIFVENAESVLRECPEV